MKSSITMQCESATIVNYSKPIDGCETSNYFVLSRQDNVSNNAARLYF